jgi:hypothetical protein
VQQFLDNGSLGTARVSWCVSKSDSGGGGDGEGGEDLSTDFQCSRCLPLNEAIAAAIASRPEGLTASDIRTITGLTLKRAAKLFGIFNKQFGFPIEKVQVGKQLMHKLMAKAPVAGSALAIMRSPPLARTPAPAILVLAAAPVPPPAGSSSSSSSSAVSAQSAPPSLPSAPPLSSAAATPSTAQAAAVSPRATPSGLISPLPRSSVARPGLISSYFKQIASPSATKVTAAADAAAEAPLPIIVSAVKAEAGAPAEPKQELLLLSDQQQLHYKAILDFLAQVIFSP